MLMRCLGGHVGSRSVRLARPALVPCTLATQKQSQLGLGNLFGAPRAAAVPFGGVRGKATTPPPAGKDKGAAKGKGEKESQEKRTPVVDPGMTPEQRAYLEASDPPNYTRNPIRPDDRHKFSPEEWGKINAGLSSPKYTEDGPFPQAVQDLVDKLFKLNLMELMVFFKAVSAKMGIPFEDVLRMNQPWDALNTRPAGPGGAQAPTPQQADQAAAGATAAAPAAKPAGQILKLTKMEEGAKYKVLKEIKLLRPALKIDEAKSMVENLPTVLLENATKEEMDKWTEKLKAAGGHLSVE